MHKDTTLPGLKNRKFIDTELPFVLIEEYRYLQSCQ